MKNLYIFLLLLFGVVGFGQKKPLIPQCYADQAYQELVNKDPSLSDKMNRMNEEIRNFAADYKKSSNKISAQTDFTIPVVVYVVHNNQPLGIASNIADTQVQSQIVALNTYFAGSGFNFCLATKAGSQTLLQAAGNLATATSATSGIVHVNNTSITSHLTTSASQQALINGTSGVAIGQNSFLRIWVVESINGSSISGIQGYSYFPNTNGALDGIVMNYRVFGDNTNTSCNCSLSVNFQQGKTLPHEVGHYFGLRHTFKGGCHDTSGLNNQMLGDLVTDTPPVQQANEGCPPNVDTCIELVNNLPDDVSNYMDYTYDACKNHFTNGQKDRMLFHLLNYRSDLYNVDNLIFTGVCGSSNLVSSNFTGSLNNTGNSYIYNICSGSTIYFKPVTASTNYPAGTLVYLWDFGNGITSNLENPSSTYNLSSTTFYIVKLTVTYNGNSSISTKNIFVNNCLPILNKESTWYFSNSNILKFNSGVPRTNGTINFPGVGEIIGPDGGDNLFKDINIQNDDNGNVLFFTDGKDVFNGANPAVKINNTRLIGNGNNGQEAVILKSAANNNQYYIIHTMSSGSGSTNGIYNVQTNVGIRYSIVNVNSNGIPSMTSFINTPILPTATQTGYRTSPLDGAFIGINALQAIEKIDGGYWIITAIYKLNNSAYIGVFDLTINGTISLKSTFLLPNFITPIYYGTPGISNPLESVNLSVSPNGDKIIYNTYLRKPLMLDFDKYDGLITQTSTFDDDISGNNFFMFSPNSRYIYSKYGQMDINTPTIARKFFSEPINNFTSALIGTDNKIYYLNKGSNSSSLSVIHRPNSRATISNPNSYCSQQNILNTIQVNGSNKFLPNFIQAKRSSAYNVNQISAYRVGCNSYKFFPDVTTISNAPVFSWNFGDPNSGATNNTSALNTPIHVFSGSGNYTISLTYNGNVIIVTQVTISTFTPSAIQGTESKCLINGAATSFNSVALQDGQTVVWSILNGSGTIVTNNQSEVQITWEQLPGTISALITDPSGCSGTVTKTIALSIDITPTFTSITPVCSGMSFTLPATSNNNILGAWSPAVNNTVTTTYTFTPNSGQCATNATLTVSILPPNNPNCIATSCLPDLTLYSPDSNVFVNHLRLNWIETNSKYETLVDQDVTLKAGDFVYLKPNTLVRSGSQFIAKIEACISSSSKQSLKVELFNDNLGIIFPNPTTGLTTITSKGDIIQMISIATFDGKIVFFAAKINNAEHQIDLTGYASGVYLIAIQTKGGGVYYSKLLKE